MIAVADVVDRIVHTSIYRQLAPSFERRYIHDSYACLPGRGSHRAIYRFREFQRNSRYLLHLDIKSYYPSIDHGILAELIERHLRDECVLRLIALILDSGAELYRRPAVRRFYGVPPAPAPRGLPIGNLTSQWWGNLYLDGLDHFIKRELKVAAYLRYMDDLVLFGPTCRQLVDHQREITSWLREQRRLEVKVKTGEPRSTRQPCRYLGYSILPTGIKPLRRSIQRFRRAVRELQHASDDECHRRLAAMRGNLLFGS